MKRKPQKIHSGWLSHTTGILYEMLDHQELGSVKQVFLLYLKEAKHWRRQAVPAGAQVAHFHLCDTWS